MSDHEQIMQQITTVQAVYADDLMHKKNVVGVAVGMKKRDNRITGQLSLVVLVEIKVPMDDLDELDRVPPELGGVVTDVQETGSLLAL